MAFNFEQIHSFFDMLKEIIKTSGDFSYDKGKLPGIFKVYTEWYGE